MVENNTNLIIIIIIIPKIININIIIRLTFLYNKPHLFIIKSIIINSNTKTKIKSHKEMKKHILMIKSIKLTNFK